MTFGTEIQILTEFGNKLNKLVKDYQNQNLSSEVKELIQKASAINPWFTSENIWYGLSYWASMLNEENLERWLDNYQKELTSIKNVGIITAGNIPFVGIHDLLCVYLSGHNAVLKTSSDDPVLTKWMISMLAEIDRSVAERFRFVERIESIDAVIATGSNNSARYFEYYFGKYPNIIRKNRNSIAIVTVDTTDDQLRRLADDVFQYFGLGCRSVSKLYLPEGFDLQRIFGAFYDWRHIIQHHRYASNYDYNRVVYLMSKEPILENGFFILRQNQALATPVSVVHYEYYSSYDVLASTIHQLREQIQCIVGAEKSLCTDDYGRAQWPAIDSYADGVDTMQFLLQL
ncbi:acyl-CoA reductase [Thermaurantimonas aggregans]|uniref:Acyl-CoA reductase n=1 Tax=Thermaurantimonas aggregans TaxID=2173829 RepID=A0A401XJV6_9FLAO|nr:acyl-CoA reductase [Thermaurantimonas aggregans]MCX8148885.1 acyl-CoA reductase [Thermaurantimonas aggregans]GCD77299.1 acyl-CoA reductase [Thermaurantimonas aggregans]